MTGAVTELWNSVDLPEPCLEHLRLDGSPDAAAQSSFRLGAAAQASIACSALAAAHFHELNGGDMQTVTVDARHAVLECASERYYELDGNRPPPLWDPLAGAYQTADGWVRIHTNFPQDGILQILGCKSTREDVAAALRTWSAEEFETVASERGMCVAALRTLDQWDATPQALANKDVPPIELVCIGDAPKREQRPSTSSPFSGVRVLELTRVLAGPTCGRTLAGYGADVLWVTSPHLPALPGLDVDTSRGKRTTQLDLASPTGRERLQSLAVDADVFLQSYRADSLSARGLAPADLAAMRPGIIYAQLNAYGWRGPCRERRGFDSLVQTATGLNVAEAAAFAADEPRPLPFQALDHVAGYLLALGVAAALCKRVTEGGSWEVRVSLAGVSRWVRGLGRAPTDGLPLPAPGSAELGPLLEDWQGEEADLRTRGRVIRAVRHAAPRAGDETTPKVAPLLLDVHSPAWL